MYGEDNFVTGTNPVPTRILVLYVENDGNSHVITMCEVQVFTDPGERTFCFLNELFATHKLTILVSEGFVLTAFGL